MPLTLDDVQVMLRGLLNGNTGNWLVVGWIDSGHIGVSLPRHARRLPWAMRLVRRELGAGTRLVAVHSNPWRGAPKLRDINATRERVGLPPLIACDDGSFYAAWTLVVHEVTR